MAMRLLCSKTVVGLVRILGMGHVLVFIFHNRDFIVLFCNAKGILEQGFHDVNT